MNIHIQKYILKDEILFDIAGGKLADMVEVTCPLTLSPRAREECMSGIKGVKEAVEKGDAKNS